MNDNNCCLSDILNTIKLLQDKSERFDDIPSTCDRPFLGNITQTCLYNTRPVTFYTCNNNLITMPYNLNGASLTSTVFRVENVSECCCTCRVLAPNHEAESDLPYVATDSFFTINNNCICALRCLSDTFVDCV